MSRAVSSPRTDSEEESSSMTAHYRRDAKINELVDADASRTSRKARLKCRRQEEYAPAFATQRGRRGEDLVLVPGEYP